MGGIKRIGMWLRDRVRRDKESLTLLIIYLIVILWVINLNT